MEKELRDIHIKVTQDEWELIKIEAIRRGLSMKSFILGCIGEIINQDKKVLEIVE